MSTDLNRLWAQAQQKISQAVDYLDTATTPGLTSGSIAVTGQLARYAAGSSLKTFGMETHGTMTSPVTDTADAFLKVSYWLAVGARLIMDRDKKLAAEFAMRSKTALENAAYYKTASFVLPLSLAAVWNDVHFLSTNLRQYDPGAVSLLDSVVFPEVYRSFYLRVATLAASAAISGYVVYRWRFA